MEEIKEPIKISVDKERKTITVSKGYDDIVLSETNCRIIGILYENILKDKQDDNG